MNGIAIIKFLVDNAAFLSGIFLAGALVKVYLYYKFFGLYIFEFVSIGEVLILFAGNLMSYFIILVALFIMFELYHHLPVVFTYLLLAACTLGLIVYYFARQRILVYEVAILISFLWITFFLVRVGSDKLLQEASPEDDKYMILSGIVISIMIYSMVNAFNEYYKVKRRKIYSKVVLVLEAEEILSDEKSYYIGKTEKFVFFFHTVENKVEVILGDLIKRIIFIN